MNPKVDTKTEFEQEKKALQDLKNSEKIIHLTGDYGIGKTRLLKSTFKETQKDVLHLNDFLDKKEIIDKVDRLRKIKANNCSNWKIINWWRKIIFYLADPKKRKSNIYWYKFFWKGALLWLVNLPLIWSFLSYAKVGQEWYLVVIMPIAAFLALAILFFYYRTYKWSWKKGWSIIIIENIDRNNWDEIIYIFKRMYELSKTKKITFFVSYSNDNLKNKFLLKYGNDFEKFDFFSEIEKFVCSKINLNSSVKDVRWSILRDVLIKIKDTNLDNYEFKENIKKIYEIMDLKNFRILWKSLDEIIKKDNQLDLEKYHLSLKNCFNLIFLKHFDPLAYENLYKEIDDIEIQWNNWLYRKKAKITSKWYWDSSNENKEKTPQIYLRSEKLVIEIINSFRVNSFKEKNNTTPWKYHFVTNETINTIKTINNGEFEDVYENLDIFYRKFVLKKTTKKIKFNFGLLSKFLNDLVYEFDLEKHIIKVEHNDLKNLSIFQLRKVLEYLYEISRNNKILSNIFETVTRYKYPQVLFFSDWNTKQVFKNGINNKKNEWNKIEKKNAKHLLKLISFSTIKINNLLLNTYTKQKSKKLEIKKIIDEWANNKEVIGNHKLYFLVTHFYFLDFRKKQIEKILNSIDFLEIDNDYVKIFGNALFETSKNFKEKVSISHFSWHQNQKLSDLKKENYQKAIDKANQIKAQNIKSLQKNTKASIEKEINGINEMIDNS